MGETLEETLVPTRTRIWDSSHTAGRAAAHFSPREQDWLQNSTGEARRAVTPSDPAEISFVPQPQAPDAFKDLHLAT